VVKVAKPGQDLRFDVPVVGLSTLETLREAGAAVLAVESGAVILMDRKRLIEEADRSGLAVVGFRLP